MRNATGKEKQKLMVYQNSWKLSPGFDVDIYHRTKWDGCGSKLLSKVREFPCLFNEFIFSK